jgi:hypothetical protein
VTIVEMMDDILLNVNMISKYGLMESLAGAKVTWSTGLKVESVTDSGALVADRNGERKTLEGTPVFALGLKSNALRLPESHTDESPEIHYIGDCVSPRKIWNAIHEGFRAGNSI